MQAQTVTWVQEQYPSAPAARAAAGITYDGASHSTFMFGGANGQSIYGDTWTWNGKWNQRFPLISPSPRQGPAIAYDAGSRNVVLFGGSPTAPVGNGTAFGDTWTWDGLKWTQQFPPVSPPARVWSNMVYVPATNTVLLFGGTNTPGGDDPFNDTWVWNGIARNWTELYPAHHPSARLINQLVYDVAHRNVVLFGGTYTNLTNINDTWTWDGIDWTQRFPAYSPSPRNGPALAYDLRLGVVVLFGGAVGTCCSNSVNDTWTWNGLTWTEIYPANSLPQVRNAANMAYDPVDRVTMMFGGDDEPFVLGDTWLLTLVP